MKNLKYFWIISHNIIFWTLKAVFKLLAEIHGSSSGIRFPLSSTFLTFSIRTGFLHAKVYIQDDWNKEIQREHKSSGLHQEWHRSHHHGMAGYHSGLTRAASELCLSTRPHPRLGANSASQWRPGAPCAFGKSKLRSADSWFAELFPLPWTSAQEESLSLLK